MAYDRVNALAAAVLAAVVAEFDLAEVDLPARRFTTAGLVYYDAEQLSVSLIRMIGVDPDGGLGTESGEPLRCLHWPAAQFEVMLLRCAPGIVTLPNGSVRAPDPAAMQAHGARLGEDLMIATRGIVRGYRADAFGAGPTLVFNGWDPVGEADLTGGALRVTVGLV